jgi:hypothetical protein
MIIIMGISTIQILAPLFFTHISRHYGDSLGNFGEDKSPSELETPVAKTSLATSVGDEISANI